MWLHISGQAAAVLTFQEKDSKFHAMNFTGKPDRVEKLMKNLSEAATVTFKYCISTYITSFSA